MILELMFVSAWFAGFSMAKAHSSMDSSRVPSAGRLTQVTSISVRWLTLTTFALLWFVMGAIL